MAEDEWLVVGLGIDVHELTIRLLVLVESVNNGVEVEIGV